MTHYHIFLEQRFILSRWPGKWSIWSHSKISGSKRTTDTANMVRTNSVRTTFSRRKRFSVAASEICGGDHIGHHQLSQNRINGEKLSVNFRYCGAGRFDPHHFSIAQRKKIKQRRWEIVKYLRLHPGQHQGTERGSPVDRIVWNVCSWEEHLYGQAVRQGL